MAKNILIVEGSPRIGGHSDSLSDSFIEGATINGNTITKIYLVKYNINGCLGCNKCFTIGKPCVQKDDMNDLFTFFDQADMIVFVSPIYFSWFTAQTKMFIDRLYAYGHPNNYVYPIKDCILLMTSGGSSKENFDLATSYYKLCISKHLKWIDKGIIAIGGVHSKEDVLESEGFVKARALGESIKSKF